MGGLKDFIKETYHPTTIVTKAADYTVLLTDELVKINHSSAVTMTLPIISTMQGTTTHKKTYKFSNEGTALSVVAAGSGNTIGGRSQITLRPGESIIITAHEADTDWTIDSPYPMPNTLRMPFSVAVDTNGTTAVNVFDEDGAPADLEVTAVIAIAKDTNAGNMILKQGTNTVASFAKSTTAGAVTGEDGALANQYYAKGDVMTVESSTTNGDGRIIVTGTMQTYAG